MRTDKPDRPSLELDDYAGPFQPDLHLSDFSKEGLMKLVEIGGSIYGAVNRQWYQAAIKRFGQEVADELHHEVWFGAGGAGDHANFTISRLMGTRMTLAFERKGEHEWEMYTPQCDVPEAGEREGPEVMAYMCNEICGHLELFGFRHGAARWNEKVRIDPMKLPPRASEKEPHCRWRIALTGQRVDYAADPGDYVKAHGLGRDGDAEIVNQEAGKYAKKGS